MIVKPKCDIRRVVLLRHGESVWNKENLLLEISLQ
jgi:bisphosphoglycerate-dependent phosphoglycerate mutase